MDVDSAQQSGRAASRSACAISKDYLQCILSLGRATIFWMKHATEILARFARFERNRPRTPIVNSRIAYRNAQALIGLQAFVCVFLPCSSDLPMGQVLHRRESKDRPAPGGSRV